MMILYCQLAGYLQFEVMASGGHWEYFVGHADGQDTQAHN